MQKIIVKGRTFLVRDRLKRDGAQWDALNKVWYFLAINEQSAKALLNTWNDDTMCTTAYVESQTATTPTNYGRIVVYFDCDDIAEVEAKFKLTEQERAYALNDIADYGRVYVNLLGRVQPCDGLTLADVDDVHRIDWDRDFNCGH